MSGRHPVFVTDHPGAMADGQKYPASRVVPYDPRWPEQYAALAATLLRRLGPEWTIEHAGSTSVPGMLAKPVIDLVMRLPSTWTLEDAARQLPDVQWSAPVEVGDHWATFHPPAGTRAAIGHIYTAAQWPDAHMRLFADWLRRCPADRERYADLKRDLVARGVWGRDYTEAKAELVTDIVNTARRSRGLAPVTGLL